MQTDVHQHLWPAPFLAALRARRTPPRLDGWTLELPGERPYAIDPADHDVELRAALAAADGDELVCIAPSAGLGLDRLPAAEVEELAAAWLEGALELPAPFRAWAFPAGPGALRDALGRGALGLELGAELLSAPGGLDALAPMLDVLEETQRPLLVHSSTPPGGPGPARAATASRGCPSASSPWPGSDRCTASAGAPAAANRSPSTRSPSSRRRATARRRSTP